MINIYLTTSQMRLDSYIPRGENTKRGQTVSRLVIICMKPCNRPLEQIQVNVERAVESKLDDVALEPTESCTE
jgi:hypothetical protein